MPLTTNEMVLARQEFTDLLSPRREALAATKPELETIMLAMGGQLDGVITAVNAAIPANLRTKLTNRQKFQLMYFMLKRYMER